MAKKTAIFLFAVLSLLSSCVRSYSQSNDFSLTVGGVFSPRTVPPNCNGVDCFGIDPAAPNLAYEADFSHRLLNFDVASLHLELPLLIGPNRAPVNTSIFFTPSLQVRFALGSVSPFLSAGGGFAHFTENAPGNTKGAFQLGAGADFKTPIPKMRFRLEFRDFRNGTFGGTQHNLFVGGGVVFKF